jgi:hypothetical protein
MKAKMDKEIHFGLGVKMNVEEMIDKILFDTKKIRNLGWQNQHSSLEAIQLSLESLLDENNT